MNDLTTFDPHQDERYGKVGTEKRTSFEIKAKAFANVKQIWEDVDSFGNMFIWQCLLSF